jgi:hypothetical protein
VEALPAAYNAARHADALAAVDLTEGGFGGRRARAVGLTYSTAKVIGLFMLNKLLPWLFPRPALMTLNDTLARCAVPRQEGRQAGAAGAGGGVCVCVWDGQEPGRRSRLPPPAM